MILIRNKLWKRWTLDNSNYTINIWKMRNIIKCINKFLRRIMFAIVIADMSCNIHERRTANKRLDARFARSYRCYGGNDDKEWYHLSEAPSIFGHNGCAIRPTDCDGKEVPHESRVPQKQCLLPALKLPGRRISRKADAPCRRTSLQPRILSRSFWFPESDTSWVMQLGSGWNLSPNKWLHGFGTGMVRVEQTEVLTAGKAFLGPSRFSSWGMPS